MKKVLNKVLVLALAVLAACSMMFLGACDDYGGTYNLNSVTSTTNPEVTYKAGDTFNGAVISGITVEVNEKKGTFSATVVIKAVDVIKEVEVPFTLNMTLSGTYKKTGEDTLEAVGTFGEKEVVYTVKVEKHNVGKSFVFEGQLMFENYTIVLDKAV